MRKRESIKIAGFMVVLICFYLLLNKVFLLKNAYSDTVNGKFNLNNNVLAERWDGFYEKDKDTVDMLFLGTSAVHAGVDNNMLYSLCGITSYDLSSDMQKISTTYYYLQEALKYQTPSVVFIEVQAGFVKQLATLTAESGHYAFDYMRIGQSKLEALADIDIHNEEEICFPLIQYHNRWQELEQNDFLYLKSNEVNKLNGHVILVRQTEVSKNEEYSKGTLTLQELGYGETYDYLNKIVELCEENGITCVLFKTPVSYENLTEDPELYSNYLDAVSLFAQEKGIMFWNFNEYCDEMKLDYATDFADGGHLNVSGSRKFTDYLGYMIANNLNFVDRRGLEGYEEWDSTWEFENNLIISYYICNSLSMYESSYHWIDSNNYVIFIIANKNDVTVEGVKDSVAVLKKYGFSSIDSEGDEKVYLGVKNGDSVAENILEYTDNYENEVDGVNYKITTDDNGKHYIWINDEYIKEPNDEADYYMIIYDKTLEYVIDNTYLRVDGILIHGE